MLRPRSRSRPRAAAPARLFQSARVFPSARHGRKATGRTLPPLLLSLLSLLLYLSTTPPRAARAAIPHDILAARDAHLASPPPRGRPRARVGAYTPAPVGCARRAAVRNATARVWDAYARGALGRDEVRPRSGAGADDFAGLGVTAVDALDTLYVMGLESRYDQARAWVESALSFERVGVVSVFETVIRMLGGLVSAYELSGDDVLLRRAEELGARLVPAFDTPHRYPCARMRLDSGVCADGDVLLLADVGTLQMEFRALAHHSRAPLLGTARALADAACASLADAGSDAPRLPPPHDVLLPPTLSRKTGRFTSSVVTVGPMADSYFEYVVKVWAQGGRLEGARWRRFRRIVDSLVEVSEMQIGGTTVLANLQPMGMGKIRHLPFHHHLMCFVPGAVVVGLDGLPAADVERRTKWTALAAGMTETCYRMYRSSETGLCGEVMSLQPDGGVSHSGPNNLRPEAVEAMFYMYRLTGEERYREWAWNVFQALEKYSVGQTGAYAQVEHPTREKYARQTDAPMPSFAIAETLKYLYLIFGDDPKELPLNEWVFNTEAHPLRVSPKIVSESWLS